MDPDEGAMACGEFGPGRLPEPDAVWRLIASWFTGPEALPMRDGAGWSAPEDEPFTPLDPLPTFANDEGDSGPDVGLGGLSASLIGRAAGKGAKKAMALEALGEGEALSAPVAEPEAPAVPPPGPGALLAKKGKGRAAPPTDPEALNHLVNERQSAPQPIPGDQFGISVGGQPPLEPAAPFVRPEDGPLSGRHVLVTAGPTHEPIDPVRYIANRSSGQQGFAIAAAAARAGAQVTLVAGPVNLATPPGVDRIDVESAREMQAAVKEALPADVAIMVAAVADWRTKDVATSKLKKRGSAPPVLMLTENPDILATVGSSPSLKPRLLIGFAAETDKVIEHARDKRKRKGADWIVANDVSFDSKGKSVMGGKSNTVHIVTADGVENLPEMPKDMVATALVERIANALAE
jgi:phosphopantothenoylcysteine decarboxylase/phosphopantothenate--cysteine ligase